MDSSPSAGSTASCDHPHHVDSVQLQNIPTPERLAELKRRYNGEHHAKRVILIGAPGSGKGTQGERLKRRFQLAYLSTGDILREAVEAKTELKQRKSHCCARSHGGYSLKEWRMLKQAKQAMDKGELVSDEVVLGLVENKIKSPSCCNGYIMDGFPRNVTQAIALDSIVKKQEPIDAVIYFDVSDSLLLERVCGRRIHLPSKRIYHVKFNPPKVEGKDDQTGEPLVHREDDKEETLKHRLSIFHKETKPLIDYYQAKGILHTIDASLTVNELTPHLMAILGDLNYVSGH